MEFVLSFFVNTKQRDSAKADGEWVMMQSTKNVFLSEEVQNEKGFQHC